MEDRLEDFSTVLMECEASTRLDFMLIAKVVACSRKPRAIIFFPVSCAMMSGGQG